MAINKWISQIEQSFWYKYKVRKGVRRKGVRVDSRNINVSVKNAICRMLAVKIRGFTLTPPVSAITQPDSRNHTVQLMVLSLCGNRLMWYCRGSLLGNNRNTFTVAAVWMVVPDSVMLCTTIIPKCQCILLPFYSTG